MKKIKLVIPLSRFEVIVQVLAMLGILYVTFLMIFRYGDLPESIPIHYNILGEADDWGNKSSLLIVYVVILVMYIGLTLLERFPQLYNYPITLTEENIKKQYHLARSLLTILKLAVVTIFLVHVVSSFQIKPDDPQLLMGSYFLVFVMGIIFIPIIIYFILSIKNK